MIIYIDYKGAYGLAGDPYWDDVILHLNAETSLLHDSSPLNTTMVASGTPTRDGTTFKYGSYALNASGGKVTTTNGTYYGLLGAGEWTLQLWVYCTELPIGDNNRVSYFDGFLVGINPNGSVSCTAYISSTAYSMNTASGVISVDTWHHIAMTRTNNGSSSICELYVDGALKDTSSYFTATDSHYVSGLGYIVGYDSVTHVICDDYQLTRNINRYRGLTSFTPPGELPTF